MAIADVKVLTFHLTSDRGVCYEFTPVGEDVRVRRLAGRSTFSVNARACFRGSVILWTPCLMASCAMTCAARTGSRAILMASARPCFLTRSASSPDSFSWNRP